LCAENSREFSCTKNPKDFLPDDMSRPSQYLTSAGVSGGVLVLSPYLARGIYSMAKRIVTHKPVGA